MGDRPVLKREVKELDIVVTPEMILAGRREISIRWTDFVSDGGEHIWVESLTAVYKAMLAAEQKSLPV